MKTALRVIALSAIVPTLLATNYLPKNKSVVAGKTVAVLQPATLPGPIPTCNPLTQSCSNIR
jgi:hypothetical protein